MFGRRARSTNGAAQAASNVHCRLCGRRVTVGDDGRCLLGHRTVVGSRTIPAAAAAAPARATPAPEFALADPLEWEVDDAAAAVSGGTASETAPIEALLAWDEPAEQPSALDVSADR